MKAKFRSPIGFISNAFLLQLLSASFHGPVSAQAQSKEMPPAYGYYTPPTVNGQRPVTPMPREESQAQSYQTVQRANSGGPYAYPSTPRSEESAKPASEVETLRQQNLALQRRLQELEKGSPSPVPSQTKSTPAVVKQNVPTTDYRVRRGDTLWGLAIKNRTTVAALRELNHLPKDRVVEGQVLRIPQRVKSTPVAPAVVTRRPSTPVLFNYPEPVQSKTPVTTPTPKVAATGGTHVVGANENLSGIAQRYKVSLRDLQAANGLANANRIYAGQKLVVPGRSQEEITSLAAGFPAEAPKSLTPANGKPRFISTPRPKADSGVVYYNAAPAPHSLTSHRIRSTDTLESIAKERRISTGEILRYNGLKDGRLPPAGEELILPSSGTISL